MRRVSKEPDVSTFLQIGGNDFANTHHTDTDVFFLIVFALASLFHGRHKPKPVVFGYISPRALRPDKRGEVFSPVECNGTQFGLRLSMQG